MARKRASTLSRNSGTRPTGELGIKKAPGQTIARGCTDDTTRGFYVKTGFFRRLIIAILAAILFPVFAKAREKARQTQCLNNQKQIATAMLMFAQDHEELLPSKDTVWGDVNLDKGVMQCPSAGTKIKNAYGYNYWIAGKALGEVADHDATALCADADTSDNILYTGVTDIAARHMGSGIVSYLDGHVEVLKAVNFPIIMSGGTDMTAGANKTPGPFSATVPNGGWLTNQTPYASGVYSGFSFNRGGHAGFVSWGGKSGLVVGGAALNDGCSPGTTGQQISFCDLQAIIPGAPTKAWVIEGDLYMNVNNAECPYIAVNSTAPSGAASTGTVISGVTACTSNQMNADWPQWYKDLHGKLLLIWSNQVWDGEQNGPWTPSMCVETTLVSPVNWTHFKFAGANGKVYFKFGNFPTVSMAASWNSVRYFLIGGRNTNNQTKYILGDKLMYSKL